MDSIIILAALILNPRARRLRRRMAGEASNAEASSDPEALSVREIGAGCGTVNFTRSTTLNTVIGDNPCDTNIDIEKEKKEATLEEDQQW